MATAEQSAPAEYLEDHPGLSLGWSDADIEAAWEAGLTHDAISDDIGVFPLIGDEAKAYIAAARAHRRI